MNKCNLAEKYEFYELEDEIDKLKKENKSLINDNLELKNKLIYYESTKAHKMWQMLNKSDKKDKIKKISEIKVALISDQFTYDSYKYEFIPIVLTPNGWLKQFKQYRPDIFFCESAWEGCNFKNNNPPWQGKIYDDHTTKAENRKILLEILKYCKENNIPTVFWNKEDPPHYKGQSLSFGGTASKFDYIFTSSHECIKQYKKDYNHPHVYSLMFAGQPRLFNPLNLSGNHIDEIVFAGSYYTNHPERMVLMDSILDELISKNIKIKIYDRNYYLDWADFPERFLEYTNPPIDYTQTATVYKQSMWGLNFNTVTDSETMFARRVFELSLCYVNIITNFSIGVNKIFKDNVFDFDKDELPDFNKTYDEKRLNNLYNVLENHTYKSRWKQILDTIGMEYVDDLNDITVIYKIDNLNKLDEFIKNFEEINYENKILKVLVPQNCDIESIKSQYPQIDEVCSDFDDFNINSEYFCILTEDIDRDFIKKAILHYQYLNKRVCICQGENKFSLGIEENIENKIINKINLNHDGQFDVYYI